MFSTQRVLALVATLSANVIAQTPQDFQPGTLVKLGVQYNNVNVDPPGTDVGSLNFVATPPTVTVPAVNLLGPNGEAVPDRRYMIFMIDMDVIQNNVATTVLHWFQPDLVMQGGPQTVTPTTPNAASLDPQGAISLAVDSTKSITGTALPAGPVGQADYLGPGPPPGPPHRYVQVLFAQPKNFSVPACFSNIVSKPGGGPPDVQGRVGFDIAQFLTAAKINPRPIAGNFFRAQNPTAGSLEQSAGTMALRNNMCAGAPMAPGIDAMPSPPPPPSGAGRQRRALPKFARVWVS